MPNTDHDLARLAARVGRHLLDSRRDVATAESCTGGWIAKALTDIAGSSQWFAEGFITYSNESKALRLGVPRFVVAAGVVAAALTLGAAGVQVGTAYLLCPEATTSAVHRVALKSEAWDRARKEGQFRASRQSHLGQPAWLGARGAHR